MIANRNILNNKRKNGRFDDFGPSEAVSADPLMPI